MPRRATFQPSDQIVIQIADMQIPGHPVLHGIIAINDLTMISLSAKRVKRKKIAVSSSVLSVQLSDQV